MNYATKALHGYLYGCTDDQNYYANCYRKALGNGDKPIEIVDYRSGGTLKVLALNCPNGSQFRGGYVTEVENGDEVRSATRWFSDNTLRRCFESTPVPE